MAHSKLQHSTARTPSPRLDSAAPPALASAASSLSFSGAPSAFLLYRDTPCTLP